MTEGQAFGRLKDVPLREAWMHEAHAFTPWLAENIACLSEAIGIPLEVQGTEVAVEEFSADILAHNPQDGSVVLIENQLEEGDHRHLGQLMTYLAGLGAQVIVWVAPTFREAHLSAVRWLNEHTVEPYAFFAVRVRVVRIGSSPLAPLLEVVEQPNGWDRHVQEVARERRGMTELGSFRNEFWAHVQARHPEFAAERGGGGQSWRSRRMGSGLSLVEYISKAGAGVFLRGEGSGMPVFSPEEVQALETRLAAKSESGGPGHYFSKTMTVDGTDRANWDAMADWLKAETCRYERAIQDIKGAQV